MLKWMEDNTAWCQLPEPFVADFKKGTEQAVKARGQICTAAKRQAHWQAVAVAASEQCGRNRVTQVLAVQGLEAFLADGQAPNGGGGTRWQLSLAAQALPLGQAFAGSSRTFSNEVGAHIFLLSGPEGGLSAEEESGLLQRGLQPVSLGVRVLRAETAAIAAVTRLVLA